MDTLQTILDQTLTLVQRARVISAPPIPVRAGASVQAAIDAAPLGAALQLEPGATFEGSLTLKNSVALQSYGLAHIRGSVGADAITVLGDNIALNGIRVTSPDATRQLVGVTGRQFTSVGNVLMGDVVSGQHRGLMLNGDGAVVLDTLIDQCWNVGRDAQAIGGWDGSKNIFIDNCKLYGGAQAVMFGGADSKDPSRVPTNITITRSLLSKRKEWYAQFAQIKTALELKSVIGFSIQDSVMEYAGTSAGQGGYTIVLKSTNQDGSAPWSTVKNVLIERCRARYGGGCVSFVGVDGSNPAIPMSNVTLRNVAFDSIDPMGITKGVGRGFTFQSAADRITLDAITYNAIDMTTDMYFIAPQPTLMVLRNIKGMLPKQSAYGVKIDAGGSGFAAVQAWAPDALIAVAAVDTGAVGVPV